MDITLKLEAQNWSDRTPTKTQLENHMGDLSSYLNKLAGALAGDWRVHHRRSADCDRAECGWRAEGREGAVRWGNHDGHCR